MTLNLAVLPTLGDKQVADVRALIRRSPGAGENPPLSERALLHLQSSTPFAHVVATDGGDSRLLGYAQVETADPAATVELVADVDSDPTRIAAALVTAAQSATPDHPMHLWAHGADSVAAALAAEAGWPAVRTLLQLGRPLADDLPEPTPPPGVVLRPFEVGTDDKAWLEVNARAFAHHPDQGGWTSADLEDRIASEWFDPAGFLLAERDGRLIGFHWTKIHYHQGPDRDRRVGEVYVLGVDPDAQGLGLGRLLLLAGLRHLRSDGIDDVILYVEADNTPAVRLYEKQGFTVRAQDVQYEPPTA